MLQCIYLFICKNTQNEIDIGLSLQPLRRMRVSFLSLSFSTSDIFPPFKGQRYVTYCRVPKTLAAIIYIAS